MISLVCGARGPTKQLVVDAFRNLQPIKKWSVLSSHYNTIYLPDVETVSIARKIREEVAEDIKFEADFNDIEKYEYLKNTNVMGINITLRDLLNLHAQSKRRKDLDYFIRNAYQWGHFKYRSILVPDWRYADELNYLEEYVPENTIIQTIRVFDPEDETVQYECDHALDSFLTDYVFIPEGTDNFYKLTEKFPQYSQVENCEKKFV